MQQKIVVSPYLLSWQKRVFDLFFGGFFLLLALPVMGLICLLVLITEGWPIFFIQERVGKDRKIFRMYKFRTMRLGADTEQSEYQVLNEADGPVFKIRNDPRFVGVGEWLSHIGLDELPQLINVLRGEMSLVGPRPLPVNENEQLSQDVKQWRCHIVPGLVSDWVITGGRHSSFEEWMKLDKRYYFDATLGRDIVVFVNVVYLQIITTMRIIVKKSF